MNNTYTQDAMKNPRAEMVKLSDFLGPENPTFQRNLSEV